MIRLIKKGSTTRELTANEIAIFAVKVTIVGIAIAVILAVIGAIIAIIAWLLPDPLGRLPYDSTNPQHVIDSTSLSQPMIAPYTSALSPAQIPATSPIPIYYPTPVSTPPLRFSIVSITFNANGGSLPTGFRPRTFVGTKDSDGYTTFFAPLEIPYKRGYYFSGWYFPGRGLINPECYPFRLFIEYTARTSFLNFDAYWTRMTSIPTITPVPMQRTQPTSVMTTAN